MKREIFGRLKNGEEIEIVTLSSADAEIKIMTQSMVYKKLVNATGRNRKGKRDWSCGKNGSSFTFK